MPTFTVHAPPPKSGETNSAPERFVFVRDGFYVWAFLLTPLWLLWRRLWLVVLGYIVVIAALGVALYLLGVPSVVKISASALLSLLIGFEASTLWRWTLGRRGYKALGFVVGDDRGSAERRFFASWVARAPQPPLPSTPTPPEPRHGAPMRRAPASDVIGLFPEPDAKP
jgi:hypothetical protein